MAKKAKAVRVDPKRPKRKRSRGMKLKDITECSGRWSTPLGTLDANAQVSDGVLVGLNLWGTSVINLVVECADGKYFGSIRGPGPVYDQVLEFLK